MHWEALCPRVYRGGAVLLFLLHFFFFLSFKEVVAVHLKILKILLLNLELKIPGGAAYGLCSPQVGGSFHVCVYNCSGKGSDSKLCPNRFERVSAAEIGCVQRGAGLGGGYRS